MKSLEQMRLDAYERIILHLVSELHARGTLPLPVLVASLESSDYSLVAGHGVDPNPVLQALIQSLHRIAQEEPKS